MSENNIKNEELLSLTTEIVSSFVGNNEIEVGDLPVVIERVYGTLTFLAGGGSENSTKQEPAVPIRRSIKPEYLICLEDGMKLKMLKRHLKTRYNLTPEEYREKWGLPADYPMVAPNYADQRRELAKKIGLGRSKSKK